MPGNPDARFELSYRVRVSSDFSAICRHSAAHVRQASAQRLQWSWACFAHSTAQLSQISAHRRQVVAMCSLPRAMTVAANRQVSAHSTSSAMQRAIALTSTSCRHADRHWLQAMAHWLQASRQLLWGWVGMVFHGDEGVRRIGNRRALSAGPQQRTGAGWLRIAVRVRPSAAADVRTGRLQPARLKNLPTRFTWVSDACCATN